ncbi:Hypothetical predicted protein [Pelobates cultripes]|uniref:Uncharacterized protein n=1 Tax=Pelobates cultripes TaxID=61616 RepID=A0AAD1WDU4_PELCU|nr:Hypothetical predicted protein [Pelobates cultripes]
MLRSVQGPVGGILAPPSQMQPRERRAGVVAELLDRRSPKAVSHAPVPHYSPCPLGQRGDPCPPQGDHAAQAGNRLMKAAPYPTLRIPRGPHTPVMIELASSPVFFVNN